MLDSEPTLRGDAVSAILGGLVEICLNGAAAHKGAVGQNLILATYLEL